MKQRRVFRICAPLLPQVLGEFNAGHFSSVMAATNGVVLNNPYAADQV